MSAHDGRKVCAGNLILHHRPWTESSARQHVGGTGRRHLQDPDGKSRCAIGVARRNGYSFQIYFDFAGYSNMAIGLGLMIGIYFPLNFNYPYIAQSITEFWRRWHITLSTWFRDYLYIPLGGNRGGPVRTYANLMVVFILCGLWHGASWTFVIWGLFHGFFLVIERVGLGSALLRVGPEYPSLCPPRRYRWMGLFSRRRSAASAVSSAGDGRLRPRRRHRLSRMALSPPRRCAGAYCRRDRLDAVPRASRPTHP